MSKTATPQGPAGIFATARRGGLTRPEILLVEELRSGDRPVSWQNIARRLGRCEADVRSFFAEPEPNDPAEDGPKVSQWGAAQVAYLKARYTIDGPAAVATVLGSTATAVSKKANRLGISQAPGWNRKRQTQALAPVAPPEQPEQAPAPVVRDLPAEDARVRGDAEARAIIAEVAKRHGVSMIAIMGGCSKRKESWARQEAYVEIRKRKPHLSLPAIGRMFWRNHTTIMHGIRAHEARAAAVSAKDFGLVHRDAAFLPLGKQAGTSFQSSTGLS